MESPMRIDGEGVDLLGEAFQEVAQGLEGVREALRARDQQAQRRAQEALRQHEERTATALREAMQQFRLSLREGDLGLNALRDDMDARIRRDEDRLNAVEERLAGGGGAGADGGENGRQVSVEHLEIRMERLEEAVKKALDEMYPRVEALVARS